MTSDEEIELALNFARKNLGIARQIADLLAGLTTTEAILVLGFVAKVHGLTEALHDVLCAELERLERCSDCN